MSPGNDNRHDDRESEAPTRPLGPYLLLDRIGRGGMADVFAAIDPRCHGIHRLVAVKMLREEMAASPEQVGMFEDEARIASQLRHPNLCAVLDHGTAQGRPFMAMEYLCGWSLVDLNSLLAPSARCAAGMRIAMIARILVEAAEGLAALHGACTLDGRPLQAVHRDVAPDNIIITCEGEVKLCDFGIVKANFRGHQTMPGKLKGKIAYMAPEAFDGVNVDHRADVWALGVVAWELLSGRRLFRRESDGATVVAARKGADKTPEELADDVSPALSEVVMRALAKDPSERFESALAFAHGVLGAVDEGATRVTRSDLAAWVKAAGQERSGGSKHECRSALAAWRAGEEVAPIGAPPKSNGVVIIQAPRPTSSLKTSPPAHPLPAETPETTLAVAGREAKCSSSATRRRRRLAPALGCVALATLAFGGVIPGDLDADSASLPPSAAASLQDRDRAPDETSASRRAAARGTSCGPAQDESTAPPLACAETEQDRQPRRTTEAGAGSAAGEPSQQSEQRAVGERARRAARGADERQAKAAGGVAARRCSPDSASGPPCVVPSRAQQPLQKAASAPLRRDYGF